MKKMKCNLLKNKVISRANISFNHYRPVKNREVILVEVFAFASTLSY
jgi:hypothetical protein